jgi:hypothetical protein
MAILDELRRMQVFYVNIGAASRRCARTSELVDTQPSVAPA